MTRAKPRPTTAAPPIDKSALDPEIADKPGLGAGAIGYIITTYDNPTDTRPTGKSPHLAAPYNGEPAQLPNPYILESAAVLNDIAYEARRATAIITGIEHEIESIIGDTDFQIGRLTTRRDLELEQRRNRIADLQKIVDAHAAIEAIQPLQTETPAQATEASQTSAPTQTEGDGK